LEQMGSENPKAVSAPLEFGAIGIEHPQPKGNGSSALLPAADEPLVLGASEESDDTIPPRASLAVAYLPGRFRGHRPTRTLLEDEIVVSMPMSLEEGGTEKQARIHLCPPETIGLWGSYVTYDRASPTLVPLWTAFHPASTSG
jgi:hypothetical protein